MKLDDEEKSWLKIAAERSFPKIDESAHFLSLYTEGYSRDPLCMLQLGYAIVMDKPLYFLVQRGATMPKALHRVASGIEYYNKNDKADLEAATTRLMKRAKLIP